MRRLTLWIEQPEPLPGCRREHAEPQQVGQEISHDLLLQGTPGDVAAATQQGQREDHLAEGKQDDAANADESDLLDHGLTLISHGFRDPGHTTQKL